MSQKPILAIALNPTIDMSQEASRVQPTLKIRTRSQQFYPGGGGTNVARVIAELGGTVDLAFLTGGATGPIFESLIANLPVGRHAFPMSGAIRISDTLFEEETGFEFRAVQEGPEVSEAELEPVLELLRRFSGGYVVASGSLPRGVAPDTYARMGRIAAGNDCRFVLDTSGAALTETVGAAPLHLFKPSIGELESLAGTRLEPEEAEQAALELAADGKADMITVTMGRDGAFMARKDGITHEKPIHVRTRSAVGAGDSFVGAMVLKLARGATPDEAFGYGLAAGAAAAMTPGTVLCRREDVEALYADRGNG
ncbi:MAG: hexose kinase [Notoacmeibacter sp.]|nr:hexose kinase [Notoacmeibacter sp.]